MNILLKYGDHKPKKIHFDDDKQIQGASNIVKKLGTSDIHESAYIVGGCIRDLLLGFEPHDYDIATSLIPTRVIEIAKESCFDGVFLVGVSFGTVNILTNGVTYEVTTFRKEREYSDGRHPDAVEYSTELNDDLLRRDFTINAMAATLSQIDLKGTFEIKVIDPYNGIGDLSRGVIRCVGDPDQRLKEDALRILRAMRFAIKYGFDIEENTFKAMINNKDRLSLISKERITEEFRKMLTCGKPITDVFLKCAEIIKVAIPEISDCVGFEQNNKYHQHNVYEHMLRVVDNCKTTKFTIKLAALLHDIGKPESYIMGDDGYGHFYGHPAVSLNICNKLLPERFRLSAEESEAVLKLVGEHDRVVTASTKSIKRALNSMGEQMFRDWMILKQADIDDHINLKSDSEKYIIDTRLYNEPLTLILESNQAFTVKALDINGNDVMKLTNGKSGKHIGEILNTLLNEVIDEKIKNEHSELAARAKALWDECIGGE